MGDNRNDINSPTGNSPSQTYIDPDRENVDSRISNEPEVDPDTQCGACGYRPRCLRPFNNLKMFAVVISCYSLFGTINFSYYSAVIYQIEKAYGLSSSVTGFLKNVDNIGFALCVICVGHIFRYANKPRVFFVASLGSSLAVLLFAFPHFIFGYDSPTFGNFDNSTLSKSEQDESRFLCGADASQNQNELCESVDKMRTFNVGALAIFLASEMLQGMFNSPKYSLSLTYMDDNAKDQSPKYFSVMFALRAFSPAIGYSLGAWTSTLYVDLSEQSMSTKDPRWVGAWWLGFVICACCSIVWILPVSLFPPKIPTKEDTTKKEKAKDKIKAVSDQENTKDLKTQMKDIPFALLRIFRSPVYIILLIATCLDIQIMGFSTFTPKYLQIYYGFSPSVASLLTGIVTTASFAIGPIVGGQITARKKITPAWALKLMVIVGVGSFVCFFAATFFRCPEEKWAGSLSKDNLDIGMPCNGNCSCSDSLFLPVCGDDGVNYYSPCHAGCSQLATSINGSQQIYRDCACIAEGTAVKGKCDRGCVTAIPYIIVIILGKFLGSLDFVPKTTCIMRIVSQRDKALAMSAFGAIILIAAFPAPLFFGLVIDSTCLVLQSSCGKGGACLQYDPEVFRTKIHLFGALVRAGSSILYIVGWFVARRSKFYEEEDEMEAQELDEMTKDKKEENGNAVEVKLLNGQREDTE